MSKQDFGEPWRECGQHRGGCPCHMVWSQAHDVPVALVLTEHDESYTCGEGLTTEAANRYAGRVRAAVNAVAGISTEALEGGVVKQLIEAAQAVLAEPYGCTLCDSGKPRNLAKGHQPDCGFDRLRAALRAPGVKVGPK